MNERDRNQLEDLRSLYGTLKHRAATFYLDFARQHRSDFYALDEEADNILLSLEWCLAQSEWHLLADFMRVVNDFLYKRGHWVECTKYNRVLLDSNAFSEINDRIEILDTLATIAEAQGNYREARHLYRQQLSSYDQYEAKDNSTIIPVLRQLVRLAKLQGDFNEAQRFLEYHLKIVQEQQSARDQVDILLELAELNQKKDSLDQADLLCFKGLEIARRIGYTIGAIDFLKRLASIRRGQQKIQEASELYRSALSITLNIGDQTRAEEIQEELTALQAVMGKDIFICYSHHDRNFAKRLARDMKATGLAVWWDKWEIKVGDSIIQKASEGINQSAYLAVVLSPHSVQSPWVQRELGSALMRQLSTERKITILPLKIAECELPILISEIMWADFTQDYQAGLRELLGALIKTDED